MTLPPYLHEMWPACPTRALRPGVRRAATFGFLWLAWGIAAETASAGPTRDAMPVPTRSQAALGVRYSGDFRGAAANERCAECHSEIAREWKASLHRGAWKDPVFQSAYAVEPLAFCRGCHAPESDPAKLPTAAAAEVGVACTTCHVQTGAVVGAANARGSAAHPVFADARLAAANACSGCHQFNFPERSRQVVPGAMQNTVAEHAKSEFAETPCQSCHMPRVGSSGTGESGGSRPAPTSLPAVTHASHSFSVIGNPEMIRSAARVEAARVDATHVAIIIAGNAVGHSFPTGDMFRRLEVRAELRDAAGGARERLPSVVLSRRFADVPRRLGGTDLSFQRVQVADDRVLPPGAGAARVVTFAIGERSAASLHYRVVYQRMSTPMAAAFRVDQVLDEITVAEGDVALDSRTPRKEEGP